MNEVTVGTRFIMPSRLPEPQARTQSVGNRNTDPASTKAPALDSQLVLYDYDARGDVFVTCLYQK